MKFRLIEELRCISATWLSEPDRLGDGVNRGMFRHGPGGDRGILTPEEVKPAEYRNQNTEFANIVLLILEPIHLVSGIGHIAG